MSANIDPAALIQILDEVSQKWREQYQTATPALQESIEKLFGSCTQILTDLSKSTDDDEKAKADHVQAELIVAKLKELRQSLGALWPVHVNSFGRDIFDVGPYHVETAEFFVPVPFYSNHDMIMKLYRWSVYDADRTVLFRYFLERSELMSGHPYYVLGRTFSQGHEQIQPYGPTAPNYSRMKHDVILNLTNEGPSPAISMTFSHS